jgi:hypothetical protein
MAANIHAAFRESPGARVLSIVGSSHKPWLDSLLGQMQGVKVLDADIKMNGQAKLWSEALHCAFRTEPMSKSKV